MILPSTIKLSITYITIDGYPKRILYIAMGDLSIFIQLSSNFHHHGHPIYHLLIWPRKLLHDPVAHGAAPHGQDMVKWRNMGCWLVWIMQPEWFVFMEVTIFSKLMRGFTAWIPHAQQVSLCQKIDTSFNESPSSLEFYPSFFLTFDFQMGLSKNWILYLKFWFIDILSTFSRLKLAMGLS